LGAADAAGQWELRSIKRREEAEMRPPSAQQRLGVGHTNGYFPGNPKDAAYP
jgi:hypothetical protein